MRVSPSIRLLGTMILWAAFFLIVYASEPLLRLKLGRPELHKPFAATLGAAGVMLALVRLRARRRDFVDQIAAVLAGLAALAMLFGVAAVLTLG